MLGVSAMPKQALVAVCLVGCYTGAPANRDVAHAWERRTSAEIEDRWGAPVARDGAERGNVLTWTFDRVHLELPSGGVAVASRPVAMDAAVVGPSGMAMVRAQGSLLDVTAAFHPGAIVHVTTAAAALVDGAGVIERVDGAALHWGPPNDANLHWGTIFGAHLGLGRLDTASSPRPSGEAYVGGMLDPTVGLVGTYTLTAASSTGGSAMGMAAGFAVQWWPANRLWLRAGPALLLTLDPGLTDAALHPGVTAAASYAFVKVGVLAIDLCVDLNAGPSTAFGTVGVGVNVN